MNRWDPELVIVSPLRRALQTACLLMERNSTPIQVRAVPYRKGGVGGDDFGLHEPQLAMVRRRWLTGDALPHVLTRRLSTQVHPGVTECWSPSPRIPENEGSSAEELREDPTLLELERFRSVQLPDALMAPGCDWWRAGGRWQAQRYEKLIERLLSGAPSRVVVVCHPEFIQEVRGWPLSPQLAAHRGRSRVVCR